MLPGFRFLFAAIVLSTSILVFGLGAAALFRTAHEEFASAPGWQPPPETRLAQELTATKPVLAMLRVDDAPKSDAPAPRAEPQPAVKAEPPAPDHVPAVAEQGIAATDESPPTASTGPQPPSEKIAVLQPADLPPPAPAKAEPIKPEVASPENPPQTQATSGDTPIAPAEAVKAAAATLAPLPIIAESTPATSVEAAPAASPAPAAEASSHPSAQPGSPDADGTSAKIATLGGPPVNITAEKAKAAGAKPEKADKSLEEKRQEAQRKAKRRKIEAERARLAQQAAQQFADPFAQPAFAAH
ncbi:hypothetical protein [Bradyrhizobium sp. dw_78]|uniref:hypothetical protein n=1 Tax=Bradyrhizobium sp. dw_78 TaxID=2719793 RepID=UPI001BD5D631|nr:hypothetical protein [Bradyrhizobium sp. dw_78]